MYGKHAVFAAINNNNRNVEKIYCLEKTFLEFKNKLHNFNAEIVSADFINKKIGAGQPHQGILALVHSVFLNNINELDFTKNIDIVVILDQITDPQNIGAIIRSASAFGITKLILPADNTPEENAAIAKAASGSLELVQIVKVTNIKTTIEILKRKDFWIAGLDLDGKDNLLSLAEFNKIAIIIGSEGKGMRRLTTESCDFLIKIPISSKVESLNASNAASIIFHAINLL
jgi:23S rRNA (guanosine2251-2'-O)-methyltransferase